MTYKSATKKLKANDHTPNAPHILIFNIEMELFAARMVRTIIDQIVYTKNTENQCFLRDKKVDFGSLYFKANIIVKNNACQYEPLNAKCENTP